MKIRPNLDKALEAKANIKILVDIDESEILQKYIFKKGISWIRYPYHDIVNVNSYMTKINHPIFCDVYYLLINNYENKYGINIEISFEYTEFGKKIKKIVDLTKYMTYDMYEDSFDCPISAQLLRQN